MSSSTVARKAFRNAVPTSFGAAVGAETVAGFAFPVTADPKGGSFGVVGPFGSATCHPAALLLTTLERVMLAVINHYAAATKFDALAMKPKCRSLVPYARKFRSRNGPGDSGAVWGVANIRDSPAVSDATRKGRHRL
jgi:hypothetical protein